MDGSRGGCYTRIMVARLEAFALSLVLGASWAIVEQPNDLPSAEARFQQELDRLCQAHGFPGATAAFVLPDGHQAGFATGYADREQSIPMRTDSLQLAGSVGKTFVSAVVLSLAQDGKLNLDDKVSKWLGRESWFRRLPNQNYITVRTLLNHSSGIPDHVRDEGFIRTVRRRFRSDPDFHLSPAELVQFVLDKDALFAPGRGFSYSDTNYILAGMIVERATGSSYYGELVQRFLTPLGLSLTGPADRRGLPSLAPGYVAGSNPFGLPRKTVSRGMLVINPSSEWTGGGLVSNPQDLARWAKALYEGKALKKPYLDDLIGSVAPSRGGRRYGLGVEIEKSELGPMYGHDGWFPGYRTRMAYFPDYRIAVAMQINTDDDVDERQCVLALARVLVKQPYRGRTLQ
ncbi:MAG: class A beta-lactamase-related serine hydrolase [Acidobacteria bacterium]|nr:MAG: class A beta-lactamase-related serine hydrolase [Acidobacteriota bacterium]